MFLHNAFNFFTTMSSHTHTLVVAFICYINMLHTRYIAQRCVVFLWTKYKLEWTAGAIMCGDDHAIMNRIKSKDYRAQKRYATKQHYPHTFYASCSRDQQNVCHIIEFVCVCVKVHMGLILYIICERWGSRENSCEYRVDSINTSSRRRLKTRRTQRPPRPWSCATEQPSKRDLVLGRSSSCVSILSR